MARRFGWAVWFGAGVLLARTPAAQSAPVSTPAVPQCYRLTVGEWSRSLGANAPYHALPAVIRLDTARAERGGWLVVPDIAFPRPNRFPGAPRWIQQADSIEIMWSNGYQVTTVRLGAPNGNELRGMATVGSDANEFGLDVPHAPIVAREVSCLQVP